MTYYQTDDTGELITGPIEAREDARTPGHFFIPAGGVTTAPPEITPGHVARWSGSEWDIAEDHRGATGWVDGEPTTITELGPLPTGWSMTLPAVEPPTARTLARDNLAAYWSGQPAWIRGPFGARYETAVRLLDAGDDEAVFALLAHVEVPSSYSVEQADEWAVIRGNLITAIAALPQSPIPNPQS